MNSVTTIRFRKAYDKLPKRIQESNRKAYKKWGKDSFHPSLQFKQIHSSKPVYSYRISISWREIRIKEKNTKIWFWIGSHAGFDNLIKSL